MNGWLALLEKNGIDLETEDTENEFKKEWEIDKSHEINLDYGLGYEYGFDYEHILEFDEFLEDFFSSSRYRQLAPSCKFTLKFPGSLHPGYYVLFKYITTPEYSLISRMELFGRLEYKYDLKIEMHSTELQELSRIIEGNHPIEVKIKILLKSKDRTLMKKFIALEVPYTKLSTSLGDLHYWNELVPEGYIIDSPDYDEFILSKENIQTNVQIFLEKNWEDSIYNFVGLKVGKGNLIIWLVDNINEIRDTKTEREELLNELKEKLSFYFAVQCQDVFQFITVIQSVGSLQGKILNEFRYSILDKLNVNMNNTDDTDDTNTLIKRALDLINPNISCQSLEKIDDPQIYRDVLDKILSIDPHKAIYTKYLIRIAKYLSDDKLLKELAMSKFQNEYHAMALDHIKSTDVLLEIAKTAPTVHTRMSATSKLIFVTTGVEKKNLLSNIVLTAKSFDRNLEFTLRNIKDYEVLTDILIKTKIQKVKEFINHLNQKK